jgi:hypothetical protein
MPDRTTMQDDPPSNARRMRFFVFEYLAPLLAALGLTIVLTWPLPRYFVHSLIGEGDVTGSLGTLWNWQQFMLGHEHAYYASRLYYPQGITLTTNSIGPFSALFALPFWELGPAAAYNAAIVLGFAFTGFCMYLLARDIGCSRPASWVAGLLLMMAPLHLMAVYGHVNKVFLGFIPLSLLVTNRAFSRGRSRIWVALIGPMLVLAFFQAPEQFVIAGLGCICLSLYNLVVAEKAERSGLALRLVGMVISIGICAASLFLLLTGDSRASGVVGAVGAESAQFQPDLLQFFVPNGVGRVPFSAQISALVTPNINTLMETAVYVTWTGLFLCVAAWWTARRRAAVWLLILFIAILVSLGPSLRAAGDSWITRLEIPLPYAFLNTLPGLNMMRTPARFMLLGHVALAAAAAIGLDQLRRRTKPSFAGVFVAFAAALILLETWFGPYPSQPLLPTLPFYEQIAQDKDLYGVLDLPVRPAQEISFPSWHIYFSSFYQVDQITHGKGIATGYVSRFYAMHPLFAHFISENFVTISPLQEDMTVDGEPSSRYDNLRYYLAKNNYRYVTLHKPSDQHPVYKPGSWGEKVALRLIHDVFGDERPLVDDGLSTVYAVGPAPDVTTLKPSIALLEPATNQGYGKYRRASSPAQFLVHSPQALLTHLDVTLQEMQDSKQYAGLTLESGDGNIVATAPIAPREAIRIPVALSPGSQVITITVSPAGDGETKKLGFTMARINMATAADTESSITMIGRSPQGMQAAYGSGWYGLETDSQGVNTWRWASSPATLWVYASEAQTVTLRATPVALHDSASPDGKGAAGSLGVSINNQARGAWPVTVGSPFAVPLELPAGWSQVSLNLAAGSFRPIDVDPSSGDSRSLSFALQNLVIEP